MNPLDLWRDGWTLAEIGARLRLGRRAVLKAILSPEELDR